MSRNAFILGVLLLMGWTSAVRGESLNDILLQSAETGETSAVEAVLKLGANLEYRNKENGWTALHLAVFHGHRDTARFLLESGATVDARDFIGQTPLMAAVVSDKANVKMLDLLIEFKADLNAFRNRDKRTVLMLAVVGGNLDKIKRLLKEKINLDLEDQQGKTALELADQSDLPEVKQLFAGRKGN